MCCSQNEDEPEGAELAVGPSSRAAGVWVLRDGARGRKLHEAARALLAPSSGGTTCCCGSSATASLSSAPRSAPPPPAQAVLERDGERLRFAPAAADDREARRDRRGVAWLVEGDLALLGGDAGAEPLDTGSYPDVFSRAWAALHSPFAADLLVSAAPGWEYVDWGGTSHVPGGSHGSLHEIDSQQPLLTVGLEGERPERQQWAISDVADLVLGHFGLAPQPASAPAGLAVAA